MNGTAMTLRSIASRTSRPSWPVAYLPTGVLCNQIAMHALVRPGRFVVAEASSHVASAEATSSAALSGIASRRIRAERGCLLTPSHVAHALMPDPHDVEVVDLVAIENTHQWAAAPRCPLTMRGRSPRSVPLAVSPLCLDGARIFNGFPP
jgi:threonine aldolase